MHANGSAGCVTGGVGCGIGRVGCGAGEGGLSFKLNNVFVAEKVKV